MNPSKCSRLIAIQSLNNAEFLTILSRIDFEDSEHVIKFMGCFDFREIASGNLIFELYSATSRLYKLIKEDILRDSFFDIVVDMMDFVTRLRERKDNWGIHEEVASFFKSIIALHDHFVFKKLMRPMECVSESKLIIVHIIDDSFLQMECNIASQSEKIATGKVLHSESSSSCKIEMNDTPDSKIFNSNIARILNVISEVDLSCCTIL